MTATPSPLTCALWLAERGMYVFPVDHPSLSKCAGLHKPGAAPCDDKSRGKHPTVKWGTEATTDRAAITRMFSGAPRNVGIACKPSNLLVVDEDEPDALAQYAASVGASVEPTFTVTTSRGAHRYYKQPDGEPLGNGRGALAPFHIDVRGGQGDGGYVVAPGSVHVSGHIYRPTDPAAPVIDAPAWLLGALRPERPAPSARKTIRASGPRNALVPLVQVVLDAAAGQRNNSLYWAACRAFEHANRGLFNASDAARALLDAATTPSVGLAESEARATITSAFRTTGTRTAR